MVSVWLAYSAYKWDSQLISEPVFDLNLHAKIAGPTMPSRESYIVKRGKKQSRRRAEKEAGQKGSLFTAALGLNVSAGSVPSLPVSSNTSDPSSGSGICLNQATATSKPTSPASTFWQPIRSFALSQLTSLVRRATLRESDLAPKYEKVHNFKVRRSFTSPVPSCLCVSLHVCWKMPQLLIQLTGSYSNSPQRAQSAHTHISAFTFQVFTFQLFVWHFKFPHFHITSSY